MTQTRREFLGATAGLTAAPLLTAAPGPASRPTDETVFEDFESGTYGAWTTTGNCWTPTPHAADTLPGITGFQGKRFLSTLHPRLANAAVGRARSREFTIEHPFITFLIGGGNHPGEACLNLVIEGKVERTATGGDAPTLQPMSWDVSALKGAKARLEVVDATRAEQRGYIMVDDIRFTNLRPPQFHIRVTPSQRFEARLDVNLAYVAETPTVDWKVVALGAPSVDSIRSPGLQLVVYPGQSSSGIEGAPENDLSPLRRPLVAALVTGATSSGLRCRAVYRGVLCKRMLAPGPPSERVPDLPADERAAYLASTPSLDHTHPELRRWLTRVALLRRTGEADLDFAFRTWRHFMATMKYAGGVASPREVCARGQSDCGGLSMAFAAVLRANGVPARTLWGRWALDRSGDYGQWHVKAEFYAEGIGWVPVELAGALAWNSPKKDDWFGRDDGNFVTFHVDPDLRLLVGNRAVDICWTQFLLWFTTSGRARDLKPDETWKVALARV